MNKRYYEHTLPIIRGSLSNTYEATGLSVTFKDIHGFGQVGHRIEHHAVRHGLPFLQGQVREIVHEPLENQHR